MRTASIEICGKEHLLCFSARVVRACTEKYGEVENIDISVHPGGDASLAL